MTERWRDGQPPEGNRAGEPRVPPSPLPAPVVAGIAHDLKNLLTAIGQNCELARAAAAPGGGEHLAAIEAAADRAAGLAARLMRLALGRAEDDPALIDVGSALSSLRDTIRAVIGPHIALSIAAACGAARVRMDPGAFDRILLNLAGNAREAMPGGGRLAIDAALVADPTCGPPGAAARTGERWVQVTVTDSGKGIDARVRARLFDPGVTTRAAAGGCGQGLAVVRALVEGAGGRVFADDAAGGGARFGIALPIADEATATTGQPGLPCTKPSARGEPPSNAAAAPGSILLVEDEAAVRVLAARALRAGGYRVIEAASAEDALAAITAETGGPDLLIADLMLPGIDGRDLAAILQRRHAGLRVILVSGLAGEEQAGRGGGGTAAGGTFFLEKPYALAELRAAADAALGRG